HIAATFAIATLVAKASGATIRLIDVGGGLGIPYEPDQRPLDVARFGVGLCALTDGLARDPLLGGARLLLEPGRFLVGPAGVYLARVVDRKTVDGAVVVILDGGIHHVLRPALVRQPHRVRAFPLE